MVWSSRCFFQLNDGEQLYASILSGILGLDALGVDPGLVQVGRRGLAPDQVGVRGVGEAAGDGDVHAGAHVVEALRRALAGAELAVALVDVAREQGGAEGVGAGHDQGRDAADVGGQTGGGQGANVLGGRNQDLAAHVAALLLRGQLVLEVDAGRPGLDHALHQLEGVEGAAEAGFGVGHDRHHPVAVAARRAAAALGPLDLVGPPQGVVDAPDDGGDAVGGVQALVGVHLLGQVGVGGHLPAREVDGLQAGLDHLDRLRRRSGRRGR